jgi:hypothetical protein
MSLLDDFEILDERVGTACKESTMNMFLHRFMTPYINKSIPRNQIYVGYFDVQINDVLKCLNGLFEADAHPNWDSYTGVDISWDLSEWLDKGCNKVYIGYNYMYFRPENRRVLKFKLFNADEIIPNANIKWEYDRWGSRYANEGHKNEYKGYKILSVCNRHIGTGWLEFDMDLIVQLVGTGFQWPECDQVPPAYKIIPHGWNKNTMGEYVQKPIENHVFEYII